MGSKRWSIHEFLPLYLDAAEQGVTKEDFAKQLGIKPETVYQRVYALRRAGKDIPLLRSVGKMPLLEQADIVLAQYKAKKAKAKPADTKAEHAPSRKEEKTEAEPLPSDTIESLLGIN